MVAVLRLIQIAKLNGHDLYAYLKDVLARLQTHKRSRIEELLRIAGSDCAHSNRTV